MGGVRKTENSHSSLRCCGCSCSLSSYVIIWNRINLLIGSYRHGDRAMKTVKRVVIFAVMLVAIWNIVVVIRCFALDKNDPYYAVDHESRELSENELLAVCADALISESDKEWLLSVLKDPVVLEQLPAEHGGMLWLSDDDCSRLISRYQHRPTDICRISVSQSRITESKITTYISIEFYETEDDKRSSPSTAYPCLYLRLQASEYLDHNTEGSSNSPDLPFVFSYRKEIYSYSLKVPYDRIGTSNQGGPDAAYQRYVCDISPIDGTTLYHQEKILTPMKHHHLYLKYFGWFDTLLSV